MKKIFSWLIVIASALLALILTVLLGIYLTVDLDEPMSSRISTLTGIVLFGILSVMSYFYGLRRLKADRPVETIKYNGQLNIELEGRIDYKDYRNEVFMLTIKTRVLVIFVFILIFSFLNTFPDKGKNNTDFIFPFLLVFLGLITPYLTLRRIKKIYESSKILQDKIHYILNNEHIRLKSESLDATLSWQHFIRVKETTKFFILYQTSSTATFLSKKLFSQDDLHEFQKFLLSLNIQKG
jgi:hypothetical protein